MIALTPARRRWLGASLVVFLMLAIGLKACGGGDDGLRYRSEAVDRGDISQRVAANGQLSPVTLVSVGTQVSGIVRSYSADFNDRVEAGQILMQLDDDLLQAQLTQSRANLTSAQASLALAQSNWSRIQPLAKEGFASSQELDQSRQALREAEARVAQTRAQVQRDQVNLSYSVIRSPVSGVVVLRAVDVGQTVAASFQTPELYKIAKDLREMVIDAYFTESDIGDIRVGQAAQFRVDAYPNRNFDGEVKQVRLNPKTEQNVVTYAVVIAVENPDQILLPGMTAYVTINTQSKKNVLRVPTAALRFRPPENAKLVPQDNAEQVKAADTKPSPKARGTRQQGKVWIHTPEGLKAVRVRLGITDRQYTEITGGALTVGDKVVIEQALSSEEIAKKGMKFRMND